jgi:hypothetical protein
MRRTLVWIAMIGALGVLAIRVWPAAPPKEYARVVETAEAAPALIPLAGDLGAEACAAPAMLAIAKHARWSLTLEQREWDDVVDDNPDELVARATIDAQKATWTDGDLPQTLELEITERGELLAALQRSCTRTNEGNGYSGYYVTIAYGPGAPAIRLPSESRAALDVIAVLDKVRARYVAQRLATARIMTLKLVGPERGVTVHPDGRVVDQAGWELEPLAALEQVDVLDWALALPETTKAPLAMRGTIELAGSKKPIAIERGGLQRYPSAWRNPILVMVMRWERS